MGKIKDFFFPEERIMERIEKLEKTVRNRTEEILVRQKTHFESVVTWITENAKGLRHIKEDIGDVGNNLTILRNSLVPKKTEERSSSSPNKKRKWNKPTEEKLSQKEFMERVVPLLRKWEGKGEDNHYMARTLNKLGISTKGGRKWTHARVSAERSRLRKGKYGKQKRSKS